MEFITNDDSCTEGKETAITIRDERIQAMLIASDDTELLLDLRSRNGRPQLSDQLNFLPDPTLRDGQWAEFSEVYGTDTHDEDRPSKTSTAPGTEEDRKNSKVLVAAKCRDYIECSECDMRRCIYAPHRLDVEEERKIKDLSDERIFFICVW